MDQDLLDQRNDEKMALESIYETLFTEKLADKVWELQLTLEHLLKYLPKDNHKDRAKENGKSAKNICPYFLAGYCKFGKRCFKNHVNQENSRQADDDHLTGAKDEKIFILEFRFASGSKYPQEPILVTFTTPMSQFPKTICMKITSRLMEESKNCAEDGIPAAFSIVSLLDDVSELDMIIRAPDSRLSLPVPVGDDGMSAHDNGDPKTSGADALFGALEKPMLTEEKNAERYKQMLAVNR